MNRLILSLVAVIVLVGFDQRSETRAQQPALDSDRNGVQIEPAIPASDAMVYITSSGSKYHWEDCHHATNANAIPLSDAGAYKPSNFARQD